MNKKIALILFIVLYTLFESEIQSAIGELSLQSKIILAIAFICVIIYVIFTQ